MRTAHAVRNIRLCTKDCLCLYVCPVGATDTENGQVDFDKCIGCGRCAASCPSGALSMFPDELPPQQKKTPEVIAALRGLAASKTRQEAAARAIAERAADPLEKQFASALLRSSRLMAEDILREAGYMLPQSANAHALLEGMLKDAPADFPADAARALLARIPVNDAE